MLTVIKSNRQERLVEALADLLAGPVANPMEPEWITVQSLGMKTWLEMEISEKLGVWANFRLLFPRYLVEQIFTWVLGEKFVKSKHFEVGYLTWSVMELLPKFTHMEEFQPIAHYLANDDFGLKRFQLSSQIAKVFDEYVLYRPDMIVDWEKTGGDDWQGILWNGLVKQHGHGHFAAQAKLFFKTLEEKKDPPFPFPERISLFGIVTLPPLFVKILGSLPDSVNVNLFLVSPSENYWADIRSKREIIRGLTTDNTPLDELENLFHLEEGNPLLASMGRLGRDFLYLLEDTTHYTERAASLYEDPGEENMLTTLQSDILHLNNRAINSPPTVIAANDASVSIHACHSPMREIEVLKDRLLSLFDNDRDLKPQDIIVMAPDIDTYAPYIDAVFGTSSLRLPYRISDRSIRQGAPVIEAFLAILDMVRGRVTIQEVLDLLGLQAVQQKFDLTKDEVEIAAGWTKQVGIRWGMDAAHRYQLDQPEYEENTWQFGLDRLLLGYAMPLDNQRLFGGVLPYDEIEGQEALILGRFTSFINALFRELKALRKIRHPRDWKNALTDTLHHMMELNLENSDQHKRILDTLTRLEAVANETGYSDPVALPVVQRFLLDHLDKDQSARGFLRNGITCCSLLPMRSIPFKVVCLVGMNDGAFPRSYKGPGFDKMVGAPRMGDRSVRRDDRYLFLESLNAARQCVLITYNGFSVVDGSALPPSVLVDELLDAVKGGFVPEETRDNATEDVIRKRLVISHPLHPFNPAYFAVGDDNRLFSYSNSYLESAKKLHAGQHETGQRFSGPLPMPTEEKRLVTLSELVSFYHMPCRYLVRNRLGLHLLDEPEMLDTREPVHLDPLGEYTIGSSLLEDVMAGKSAEELFPIIRAMGVLPLGSVGKSSYATLTERVTALAERIGEERSDDALEPVDIDLNLEGTRLVGRLDNLWKNGRIQYRYANLKAKHRLELWINHLALNCLEDSNLPKTSTWIGRDPYKKVIGAALSPVEGNPRDILSQLIRIYWLGQTQPLRFFPEISYSFAKTVFESELEENEAKSRAYKEAVDRWGDTYNNYESQDPAIVHAFGEQNPITNREHDDEYAFGELALSIFVPLFQHAREAG